MDAADGSKVLVVDDEPQITRVLRTVLASQGYQVRTAADGEENQTGPWYGVEDESKITISDGYGITVVDDTGGHCEPLADRFECDVPAKMVFTLGDGVIALATMCSRCLTLTNERTRQ